MAKVRIAALGKKATRTTKRHKSAIYRRHVRGPKGEQVELFDINSNDDNFDNDLTRVFSLNIARARQANTAIFGSPDGPKKFAQKNGKVSRKIK